MDPIESVEYDGFETYKVVSRKQEPAANGNLAGDVEEQSNGYDAWRNEKKLESALAKIDPSDLGAFLIQVTKSNGWRPKLYQLRGLLDYFGTALSGVSCPWYEMFKESALSNLFHVIDLPLSHIPQPVYKTSVDWMNQQFPDGILRGFVLWTFRYIFLDVLKGPSGWVAIFVALAMILRSKPLVLTLALPSLRKRLKYHGKGMLPITVWMIAQASQDNLCVGLYSWTRNLLPLVGSNHQSDDLILNLVDKILEKPNAGTELVNATVWQGDLLIPPPSFKILLRHTFPASSARATTRFEAIYPLLKEVALTGALKSEAFKPPIQQIFTFCLRLAGEGNPVLAKEATSIAISSLTENVDCWKLWDNLYKKNLEASVALLKKLVEKWTDHSLKLSSSPSDTLASAPRSKTVAQQIFAFSLKLAKEGNPVLNKEATSIAIWFLTEHVHCWKYWDNLYKENLEASVALLKKLVEKWKDHSLKLSSSPSDTLPGAPRSKAMKRVTQKIFILSLKLAKEGNHVLAKEATSIAIWSLTENVDCWKRWDYLYKGNLEASVALLKKLVAEWKVHSLKLSSSPRDALTLTQTMNSFMLKNEKAITEGGANRSLYKEADKSCKVISGRLSCGRSSLKSTSITAAVLVAAAAVVLSYIGAHLSSA